MACDIKKRYVFSPVSMFSRSERNSKRKTALKHNDRAFYVIHNLLKRIQVVKTKR